MSSPRISSSNSNTKKSATFLNKIKSTIDKHKDLIMDSSSLEARCRSATVKPNMLATSSSVNDIGASVICCSRLTSTVSSSSSSSFETVLPNKQTINSDCTFSRRFKSNSPRTSPRTKFCATVLILLGAIAVRSSHAIPTPTSGSRLILHTQQYRQQRHQQLLQQQRSLVLPTPHRHSVHHRSIRNMIRSEEFSEDKKNNRNDFGDQCQMYTRNLEKRIKLALEQANATFFHLYNNLKAYTWAQHNDTPENFYEQWKKHSLGLNHPYVKYLENVRGLDILPEHITSDMTHLFNTPLTSVTLQREFQHISQTLKGMEQIYNSILDYRQKNQEQIFHDLRRGNETPDQTQERNRTITKILNSVTDNLNQDLHHTEQIMEELKVPITDDFPREYKNNLQHVEWHLFQEHMAVMKYLVAVYTYILQKCDMNKH